MNRYIRNALVMQLRLVPFFADTKGFTDLWKSREQGRNGRETHLPVCFIGLFLASPYCESDVSWDQQNSQHDSSFGALEEMPA